MLHNARVISFRLPTTLLPLLADLLQSVEVVKSLGATVVLAVNAMPGSFALLTMFVAAVPLEQALDHV